MVATRLVSNFRIRIVVDHAYRLNRPITHPWGRPEYSFRKRAADDFRNDRAIDGCNIVCYPRGRRPGVDTGVELDTIN